MSQPNILFLFPDQHRGDWIGCREDNPGVRTPHLDQLVARGTHFTNALTPSPLCSPARACLAYGRRYDAQPVKHNQHDVDVRQPNGYRALSEAGYQVSACGKFDLLKHAMDWGVDGQHGDGDSSVLRRLGFTGGIDSAGKHDCIVAATRGLPEPYAHFLKQRGLLDAHIADFAERHPPIKTYTNIQPTPLPDDAYCDNWIGSRADSLIRDASTDKPWFVQVNFNGPHEPLDVTETMQDWYNDVEFSLPVNNHRIEPALHQHMRRRYAAMIENIDRWVGRMIETIEQRGELDNTIIVYASDHGDELGDHDQWHKCLPTRGSTHVPLVITGPGIKHQSVTTPVDLVDVHATLLDYAAATPISGGVGAGSSLRPCLGGQAPSWTARSSGLGSWRMIFDGRFKYIHNHAMNLTARDVTAGTFDHAPTASGVLFDLSQDPGEEINLVNERPDEAAALRSQLLTEIEEATGSR